MMRRGDDKRRRRRSQLTPRTWLLVVAALAMGCADSRPSTPRVRPPEPGFCVLSDDEILRHLLRIDVPSYTSASAAATMVGGTAYVLTNRHNLPATPDLAQITVKTAALRLLPVRRIVAAGVDYGQVDGLGPATDFAVLEVTDIAALAPLSLLPDGGYQGPVVVPHYGDRRYTVSRGRQWRGAGDFDRLDLALPFGASGAPVITCDGQIAGLYTARVIAEDWQRAGFQGVSTPAAFVRAALSTANREND